MPLETVVPAPVVTWDADFLFPVVPVGTPVPFNIALANYRLLPPLQTAQVSGTLDAGGSAGSGATTQFQVRQGRLCAAQGSTGATCAYSLMFPWWAFNGNGGASENSGYTEAQGVRTAWFRIGINISAIDPTWGAGSGFYFVPYNGVGLSSDVLPGGPSWNGGVGIGGDLAGGLSYRSYGVGAANLLETVPIPAAALATVTKWSTVDFFFRAASPGVAGYLSVLFNGTPIVTQKSYGSGLLSAPSDISANAWTYALNVGIRDTGPGPTFLRNWIHARFGRFLMDGTEATG